MLERLHFLLNSVSNALFLLLALWCRTVAKQLISAPMRDVPMLKRFFCTSRYAQQRTARTVHFDTKDVRNHESCLPTIESVVTFELDRLEDLDVPSHTYV
jgi:hypothetical protein